MGAVHKNRVRELVAVTVPELLIGVVPVIEPTKDVARRLRRASFPSFLQFTSRTNRPEAVRPVRLRFSEHPKPARMTIRELQSSRAGFLLATVVHPSTSIWGRYNCSPLVGVTGSSHQ